MSFWITLSGSPVEARTTYATAKWAEHIAHIRYSDPPVRADKLPHIKRRLWWEKGYRVEMATAADIEKVRPTDAPYPMSLSEGHECHAGPWNTVSPDYKQRTGPTYRELCRSDHREKMEHFAARAHFHELRLRESGEGATDAQCWHQMNNGLPCLLRRGHSGEHGL